MTLPQITPVVAILAVATLLGTNCVSSRGYASIDRGSEEELLRRQQFRRLKNFVQRPIRAPSRSYAQLWFLALAPQFQIPLAQERANPGPHLSSRSKARILLWLSARALGQVPGHEVATFVDLKKGVVKLDAPAIERVIRPKSFRPKTAFVVEGSTIPRAIVDFGIFPFVLINVFYVPATGRSLFGSVRKVLVRGRLEHSSDSIMNHFGPGEFREVMANAGYGVADLDLTQSDVAELTREGYLPLN